MGLRGAIVGTTGRIQMNGPGTVTMSGGEANSYTGFTGVVGGLLVLNKTATAIP